MQTTSPAFSPYAPTRWVDFLVRFELLDVNARTAAAASVGGQENVSQLAQLTDGKENMGGKWATPEDNCWLLDGTFDLLPNDVAGVQTGWWSDALSGDDCVFASPPSLSFGFGGVAISSIGFTLCFDAETNNFPTSIRVTICGSDGAVIRQKAFINDSTFCALDMPVQNYYSVKFEFLATSLPHRRVRLAECLFGIVQIFNRNSLGKAELIYSADPLCEVFPSRQLEFTFNNADHKYNLINPNGLYAYLQEGQDIYTSTVINGEAVSMGKFEYMKAEGKDDEITGEITANDYVLSALDNPAFNGGSNTTDTLQNAVNTVLSGLGITTSIENPSYLVSMTIPRKTTKREAIRYLAQAAMCSVWVDRGGVLQIHPLTVKTSADDELNADRMPSMAGISVSEPVDSMVLTVRNEYATDIDGKLTTQETAYTAGNGKRVRTFENPCVAAVNGQAVANWLLQQCNRRVHYEKPNRGNPAVEIGDTLKIYDAYGENRNAVVTDQEFAFDGGFSAKTKALGP